jgi:hypothetical protein
MPEGSIDAQKLLKFVTKDRSDPWKSILAEAVAVCKNYTDGKLNPSASHVLIFVNYHLVTPVKEISFYENLRKKTCKTEAVHMVQCLQAVIALVSEWLYACCNNCFAII